MNPLTLVKRIQSINSKEADLGISDEASWHAKYRDSAYVFVGGIPYDLTEGDILAVFAQYGEVVDVNLVRDKATGKSKGFAFLAYEDQRSTILAVDNLNGAQISGRTIRVDHCSKYKKKEEEDEETERQKREARGVCRAFQKGECTRGASCKFSHDEQRAANTGWGHQEDNPQWGHDKFEGSRQRERRNGKEEDNPQWGHDKFEGSRQRERRYGKGEDFRSANPDQGFRSKGNNERTYENNNRESDSRREMRNRRHEDENELKSEDGNDRREEKRSRRHDSEFEPKSRESMRLNDYDYRRKQGSDREHHSIEERGSRRHENQSSLRGEGGPRSRDSSSRHIGERENHSYKRDR